MAWVRLDDHFDEHPKLAKVGPLGWGVWAASLAYCNRNLTDGFIPWNKAHMLASFDLIDSDGKVWSLARDGDDTEFLIDSQWVIAILVDAGLWDVEKDGYRIHDYNDYQPTKQQILDERAKKVAAGQAGGQASAQARAQASAQAESKHPPKQNASKTQAESNPKPKPTPTPTPSEDSEESSLLCDDEQKKPRRIRSEYPEDFETFWQAYPAGHGIKGKAYERWKQLAPDDALVAEIMAGLETWRGCERWEQGYVKSAEIWLRDAWWANEPPPRKVMPFKSNGSRAEVETFNGSPIYDHRGNPTPAYFLKQAHEWEIEDAAETADRSVV